MENEIKYKGKQKISRQKIANIINPLKTGKTSKYFNQNVIRFLKDPKLLGDVIMDSIRILQNEDLDIKERILYTNILLNAHKTIFGNKNLNINMEVTPEQVNKKVYEIIGDIRSGEGR